MLEKKKFVIVVAIMIVIMQVASAQQRPSRPPKPKVPLHNERNPYTRFQIFYVGEIEREDGVIEIEFNMPFNPESVTRENILINDAPLPPNVPMSFNRRGNKINIKETPEWYWQEVIIEIKNIRSINDLEMQRLDAFYLGYDDDFEWDEQHKVRWVNKAASQM